MVGSTPATTICIVTLTWQNSISDLTQPQTNRAVTGILSNDNCVGTPPMGTETIEVGADAIAYRAVGQRWTVANELTSILVNYEAFCCILAN